MTWWEIIYWLALENCNDVGATYCDVCDSVDSEMGSTKKDHLLNWHSDQLATSESLLAIRLQHSLIHSSRKAPSNSKPRVDHKQRDWVSVFSYEMSTPSESTPDTMEQTPMNRKRKDGVMYVERNSLVESELKQEHEKIKSVIQNKPKEDISEADFLEERRAANRLSAFQSRKRRKAMIDGLQKTVADLSSVNAKLHSTADDLQTELKRMREENDSLRQQCLVARNQKRAKTVQTSQDIFLQASGPPTSAPQRNHMYMPAAPPPMTTRFSSQIPTATPPSASPRITSVEDAALNLILDLLKSRVGQG